MRKASVLAGLVLAVFVVACANAPTLPPPSATPPSTGTATVPNAGQASGEPTQVPGGMAGAATEEPRPTITVNPHLHATHPQNVKLASGDQPTLVEFFAFW
jgi:hypothetical protein